MAKYLKKYKTREDFENGKTALIHDLPELEIVVGLVDDIEDVEVIKDDDRLIHAVYEFPEDIPEGSNPFCENSDIIKRFIIDGIEIDFGVANNMSWSKGIHKVAFHIDDRCGDDTLNFQDNKFLSSIVFRENCALQKLPRFSNSSLKSVNIRSTRIKSIGESAFSSCQSLTLVNIPSSVTSIEMYAFYYCKSLTSINIPEGVRSIGERAFYGCSKLTSITIPASVTSIGNLAFRYCTSLTSINIPEGVMSIGMYAFECCSGLTSINIPESVTSIRIGAFRDCYNLTSITLPKSVTSIESTTFQNCTSLTTITIPESVTSIGSEAFYGCSGITSITIPASVTSIGIKAFYNCSGLTSITCFAITAPTIYNQTFRNIATGGVLKYPPSSDYSSWMSTSSYYLGYYNWTSQEIEV